jgi:hypothetical protein
MAHVGRRFVRAALSLDGIDGVRRADGKDGEQGFLILPDHPIPQLAVVLQREIVLAGTAALRQCQARSCIVTFGGSNRGRLVSQSIFKALHSCLKRVKAVVDGRVRFHHNPLIF